MSNLTSKRDLSASGDGPAITVRKAEREEVHACLRLILGSSQQLASESQVVDFLRFAMYRGINLSDIWLADRRGAIVWAVLPVISPGRTSVLFSPPHVAPALAQSAVPKLIDLLLDELLGRGTQLAQVLIDPGDSSVIQFFERVGFSRLAELLYLSCNVRRAAAPELPRNLRLLTYCPEWHGLFARTISATYTDSLDCPALNGRRDIEDILAGHKAVGHFDPANWFCLLDRDEPLGISLLNHSPHTETMELVYFGLVPLARGKGYGDLLMRHTLAVARTGNARQLTLAVDSRNAPAIKLYERHGLKLVCSKIAMLYDLGRRNRTPAPSSTIPSRS